MKIFYLSSSLGKNKIIEKSKPFGIAISPKLANSIEQMELAALLAEKSFKSKTNIAKTPELEFLLWLSEENDLRKAFAKNDFSSDDFYFVSLGRPFLNKKSSLRQIEDYPLRRDARNPGKRRSTAHLPRVSLGKIEKKKMLQTLRAQEKPISLREKATEIELEKTSLSRL